MRLLSKHSRLVHHIVINPLTINVRSFRPKWVAPTMRVLNKRRKVADQIPDIRSNYIDWNYNAELEAFTHRIGEAVDIKLLHQAMIHSTYNAGIKDNNIPELGLETNSTLVKSGEDWLSNVTSSYLKSCLPEVERVIGVRKIHDHLLSVESLSEVGNALGLRDLIKSGEYPPSKAIVADTFKALTQAVFQSCGQERLIRFVLDFVATKLSGKDLYELLDIGNPYKSLQELLETEVDNQLESRLMWSSGTNTILGVFVVGVYYKQKHIGTGYGETANIAEEMAAHDALRKILKLSQHNQPLLFGAKLKSSIQLGTGT